MARDQTVRVLLMVFLAFGSGFAINRFFYPHNLEEEPQDLAIRVFYAANAYLTESARTDNSRKIEGTIVYVTFYNLTLNKTYTIDFSQVRRNKEFNNLEEITVVLRVEYNNWCELFGGGRGLILIHIGDIIIDA